MQKSTKATLRVNTSHNYNGNDTKLSNALEKDREFYCQLPKKSIKQLYEEIYATDFQMLGYKYPQEYIDMGRDNDD